MVFIFFLFPSKCFYKQRLICLINKKNITNIGNIKTFNIFLWNTANWARRILKFRQLDWEIGFQLKLINYLKKFKKFQNLYYTKASLKRLQTSYVDIIYAHRYDPQYPLEEVCRSFDWLVRKGYAHYWGTSEWTAEEIFAAVGVCERFNLIKPQTEQPQYNIIIRDKFEWKYKSVFEKLGFGSTVWSPLFQGVLSGKYNENLKADGRLSNNTDHMAIKRVINTLFGTEEAVVASQKKLQALGKIAEELGCSQVALAMGWVIKNKDVQTAITGASRPEYIDDSVMAVKVYKLITPEIEQRIEEIFKNKPQTDFSFQLQGFVKTRRDLYI